MKKILMIFLFSVTSVACSSETQKEPTLPPVVITDNIPKEEVTCIMVWDAKQQKEIKKCRTIKIHEKHEGTKVPTK